MRGELLQGGALDPPGLAVALALAPGAQMLVQGAERGERARVGHERVSAHVADEVLDRALLVATPGRAEARSEEVVRAQRREALVLLARRA